MKTYTKIFLIIFILFILSRVLPFAQIYHQDEYKWAMIADSSFGLNLESDHPPMTALLYRGTGAVLGYDHLRALPILFSIFNIILIYFIALRLYGKKAALWTAGLLLPSIYFFIASSEIDIDGAILPFFGLLSIYLFYRIDFTEIKKKENIKWFVLLFVTFILGFLIKLSFVLFAAAIVTEYFVLHKPKGKTIIKLFGWSLAAVAIVGALVYLLDKISGVQNAGRFLSNVWHFVNFSGRNYSQVLFLGIKSVILLSPLFLLPYLFILSKKESIKKYRIWFIYVLYNFLFYFVIFDFTNRTIERYMMFMIIPSAIIAGSFLADNFVFEKTKTFFWKLAGAISLAVLPAMWLFNLPFSIFPLNPKFAYIDAVKHFNFDFLIPITGGSGPIGFYVLASYILFAFTLSFVAVILYFVVKNQNSKQFFIMCLLCVGLVYNIILSAEFIFGLQYGKVSLVAKQALAYVVEDPQIEKITTYYDIGGYELYSSKKYGARFYTDPMYEAKNLRNFPNYDGYYLVVDFPEISKESLVWKYLTTCRTAFSASDKSVNSYVFDCKEGNRNLFQ
ncbi:MAG: glycosyltransferase family 39 protein [Candidatus Paceibacterota bacterium]